MAKLIKLKLCQIKYSGDSIGDDIRVEIEILDKFLRVDKMIKIGGMSDINKEISDFETDQKTFKADVKITVIEKDILFNDVGNINGEIAVDTSIARPQKFIYQVQIKETHSVLGKIWGDRIADFEIILEAMIGDIERYAPDIKDGWLTAFDLKNNSIALPAYIKVRQEYIKNRREYFTPLEGPYRHQLLSVKLQDDESSYFISNVQHEPMAAAAYSISTKLFTFKGKKYQTIDDPEVPWKKGLYDIEIPDHPHGRNNLYTEAVRQKVWFRIGHDGARYLHPGKYSNGCMTMIETTRWMEIYNALIKARKGDFASVGIVEVID